MNAGLTVAVDAMSGDHGAAVAVPAALDVLASIPDLRLIIVGRGDIVRPLLGPALEGGRCRFVEATEVVGMDERPKDALRRKKNSSMRVAINLVEQGEAAACVSAGNTGALLATARFVLGMVPGIDRPAIVSAVPSVCGHTVMLDLGANPDCNDDHLVQFAVMGSVIASDLHGILNPRVALLNVGEEDIKGTEEIKAAHKRLLGSAINYCGFVEGDKIFSGDVDVVVTDGFTGNVSLKTMEGLARFITGAMKEEFTRSPLRKMGALAAAPTLKALKARLDPRAYNGASMVGLNGVVIKSHGSADRVSFANAVRVAVTEARNGVPGQIGELLARVTLAASKELPEVATAAVAMPLPPDG